MKFKYIIIFASILFFNSSLENVKASNINYENACNAYGFNEQQCTDWQEQNARYNSSKNIAQQELVYKIRLRDAATGNFNQSGIFSPGDKDREEWIVVTLINNQQVRVRHATNIQNKFWGTRQWYDHPAIAIRICDVNQFDYSDCQNSQGDVAVLPEGKTIHDVQIDFKYSEGGAIYTRSVQISSDTKPDD